jgi:hypothetical protein
VEPGWVPSESPPRHKPSVESLASPSAESWLWTRLFPSVAIVSVGPRSYTRLVRASTFPSPSSMAKPGGIRIR